MGSTDEIREQIRRRLDVVTRGGEPSGPQHADLADRTTGDRDDDQPGWLHDDAPDPEHPRIRFALGRRGVLALAVVALVAAGIGAVAAWRDRPVAAAVEPLPGVVTTRPEPVAVTAARGETSAPVPAPPRTDEIVVSVVGLVHVNGLVHLPAGSRVADALAAAGGTRDGADVLGLNLARKLADGDQVLVGVAPPPGAAPVAGSATVGSGQAGATGGASPGGKVNLNTATAEQLDALPGVGPVTAASIVAWRTANGTFSDVEQLGEVDGIGPGRLDKLRDLVSVG
ncbi:ComEA family DNA-binding protein [Rhodococcus sp. NPDC003318]|uniref:ComEA family DNA-binding protein n=1 Tax=Rhodococcus sp. NPDC003318 TaxID=3364503 RepID=UPI0036B2AFBD